MHILVEINHPAQLHMFRPAMDAWAREGTEFLVVAREKDITTRLMDNYGIPYTTLAAVGRGLSGQFVELARREFGMLRLARRLRPKVITGTSVHAARIARLVGARSVILCEDDAKYIPLFKWLAYSFSHAIVTPDCLAYENHGPRHFTYPAFQKLFYLHPSRFAPDPEIDAALGLSQGDRYALVRLSSLQAHHDVGARGMSEQMILDGIKMASTDIRVFISSEKNLSAEFESLRMPLPPEPHARCPGRGGISDQRQPVDDGGGRASRNAGVQDQHVCRHHFGHSGIGGSRSRIRLQTRAGGGSAGRPWGDHGKAESQRGFSGKANGTACSQNRSPALVS
ncbi:MAG: DUF354 domain-containing protein [Planctomycetes bacterium]|nr:DUF354 domain-containing protein [Planctomycetota bacterium]